MFKNSIFIFAFLISSYSYGATVLSECHLEFDHPDRPLQGHYKIIRDGDALTSEYRHQLESEYSETDDVLYEIYEGQDLMDLRESGVLDRLCQSADVNCQRVDRVSYFGIEEHDDGGYEMEIWDLQRGDDLLSTVAQPLPDSFSACERAINQ